MDYTINLNLRERAYNATMFKSCYIRSHADLGSSGSCRLAGTGGGKWLWSTNRESDSEDILQRGEWRTTSTKLAVTSVSVGTVNIQAHFVLALTLTKWTGMATGLSTNVLVLP